METVADFLVHGMQLPPLLKDAPEAAPEGAICAMTGLPVTLGYPTSLALSDATGEFLDLLPAGNTGWVTENVARALKGMWNAGSVLVFENGDYYHPLMSRESAEKQGRPYWSGLVREVWPQRAGERAVIILTDDYKKRVWPRAEIGELGAHTAVYVHAGATSAVLYVDWGRLIPLLDRVETIARECQAALGKTWRMATYRGIAENMYEHALVRALGAQRVGQLETDLRQWRGQPEFVVCEAIFQ